MKKIIAIMMMVAVLVGCSGDKEVTLTGKGSSNGVTTEVEIVSKGDEVSKEKGVISMDLKTIGLTEEQAKESMGLAAKQFEGIDGLTYTVDTDAEKVTITTEIDYSKADIAELKNAGLLDSTSDAKYVSLKMTKENYEKQYGVTFGE